MLIIKGKLMLPYLSIAYITLLVIFIANNNLNCYNETNRIRHNGLVKIDVEWRLFVQKISNQLGIKKPVKI